MPSSLFSVTATADRLVDLWDRINPSLTNGTPPRCYTAEFQGVILSTDALNSKKTHATDNASNESVNMGVIVWGGSMFAFCLLNNKTQEGGRPVILPAASVIGWI